MLAILNQINVVGGSQVEQVVAYVAKLHDAYMFIYTLLLERMFALALNQFKCIHFLLKDI
jgi:hypothetical protein